MADDIREALKAAQNHHPDDILKYLGLIRGSHFNRPERVHSLCNVLLSKHGSRLSESELWNVREDLAIACMQLGKAEEAADLVNKTVAKFPASCRAARLKGMYLESVGRVDEAQAEYDAVLKQIDGQNLMIVHRQVALRKGKGDIQGALDLLHRQIETQLGDWQAWYEAGKLHLSRGSYTEAIFCLEEVLMHNPADLAVQLLMADSLYAAGGLQNVKLARKYYASVVEMSEGSNVKSLYGVCLCTARLRKLDNFEESDGLGDLAAERLLQEYAEHNSGLVPCIRSLLQEQGVAL
ncbi:hypothetical protein M9434_002460 [Picochlorum sp. BPE23]|nr:hypothetical protein M9434_002460 [Picochlorum sp. BPE23]